MTEVAFADTKRRRRIRGMAVRLPGIVARPAAAASFKSAFASDVFRAILDEVPYEMPVDPMATTWMLSARACAEALIHATSVTLPDDVSVALTLPALRVEVRELVTSIGRIAARDTSAVTFQPAAKITQLFGRLPPLATPAADSLGFKHDGSIGQLVQNVLERLRL